MTVQPIKKVDIETDVLGFCSCNNLNHGYLNQSGLAEKLSVSGKKCLESLFYLNWLRNNGVLTQKCPCTLLANIFY